MQKRFISGSSSPHHQSATKIHARFSPGRRLTTWVAGICFLSLVPAAHAAISLTGSAVLHAKDSTGTVTVTTGSLGLLIIDVAGDGILGLPNGTTGSLVASDNPGVTTGAAGLGVGSTFGGDLVIARLTAAGTGLFGGNFPVSLPSFDCSPYLAQGFAIVWFDQILTASAPADAPEGATFGVVHGSDWILPPVNSGAYTFSGIDANGAASFYQTDLANNPPAAIAFRTTNGSGNTAASFTVVPEPSSALIAGLGLAFPILFGRRRQPLIP